MRYLGRALDLPCELLTVRVALVLHERAELPSLQHRQAVLRGAVLQALLAHVLDALPERAHLVERLELRPLPVARLAALRADVGEDHVEECDVAADGPDALRPIVTLRPRV